MPYSGTKDPNLPDVVKKLSKELQKSWIEIFNKTYPKGKKKLTWKSLFYSIYYFIKMKIIGKW